jgi:protein-S-isoprenylcysteine O-methyltransferase Ste14
MSNYYKWAQKEHPEGTRIMATLAAGIIFVLLLPLTFLVLCPFVDRLAGLPNIDFGIPNYILGGLLLLLGFPFALWSIILQLTRGRGTPLPVMPTQELLVQGPFRLCRNPMTFGTILTYLGLGVIAATPLGIGLVLLLSALLIYYLKRFEEQELAERFGDAYLRYRSQVPFLIPRLPKK